MKKAKKVLALLLCAVLLVGASIAGTVAYLTSDDEVTNTFTVGKVVITLDEAKVDVNGTPIKEAEDGEGYEEVELEEADRVKENDYRLLPGKEYEKDPTVHVDEDSEDCYVFVKIVNEIADIEDPDSTIEAWMLAEANNWAKVAGETNVYYYKDICKAGDDVVVFNGFKIADTVDNDTLAAYEGESIVVTAYAIQVAGFENDIAGAWAAVSDAADADNG